MEQDSAIWDHCLQHAALSDVGLRRANNQDSMAVIVAGSQEMWQRRGHLFMVADGMGAHAAGELASKLATDTVALTYPKLLEKSADEAIVAAIRDANTQIHTRGQANLDFKGMGTTSTVLVLIPQGAILAQVGDSRAYRLRGDRFEQMTFDHSLVWEMRAAGQIPEDQVPDYVPKNIITRSLGPNPTVKIDLEGPFPVEAGDTYLLCSDGLSGPVEDDEMGTIIGCLPPREAVQALVDLANLRGGPDNITVIVVRLTGPQMARSSDSESEVPRLPASTRPVSPLLWTLLGVSTLATLGASVMGYTLGAATTGYWLSAVICLGVAAITAVVVLTQRYAVREATSQLDGRPLGKGPYSARMCRADSQFFARASELVEQLRKAAEKEKRRIDWGRVDGLVDRAKAAQQSGDYKQAVADEFRAISALMAQLKGQRDGDSHSNLL